MQNGVPFDLTGLVTEVFNNNSCSQTHNNVLKQYSHHTVTNLPQNHLHNQHSCRLQASLIQPVTKSFGYQVRNKAKLYEVNSSSVTKQWYKLFFHSKTQLNKKQNKLKLINIQKENRGVHSITTSTNAIIWQILNIIKVHLCIHENSSWI